MKAEEKKIEESTKPIDYIDADDFMPQGLADWLGISTLEVKEEKIPETEMPDHFVFATGFVKPAPTPWQEETRRTWYIGDPTFPPGDYKSLRLPHVGWGRKAIWAYGHSGVNEDGTPRPYPGMVMLTALPDHADEFMARDGWQEARRCITTVTGCITVCEADAVYALWAETGWQERERQVEAMTAAGPENQTLEDPACSMPFPGCHSVLISDEKLVYKADPEIGRARVLFHTAPEDEVDAILIIQNEELADRIFQQHGTYRLCPKKRL